MTNLSKYAKFYIDYDLQDPDNQASKQYIFIDSKSGNISTRRKRSTQKTSIKQVLHQKRNKQSLSQKCTNANLNTIYFAQLISNSLLQIFNHNFQMTPLCSDPKPILLSILSQINKSMLALDALLYPQRILLHGSASLNKLMAFWQIIKGIFLSLLHCTSSFV